MRSPDMLRLAFVAVAGCASAGASVSTETPLGTVTAELVDYRAPRG